MGCMSRWQPGAQQRLEQAALHLFLEQGYAETTVPQIAASAGLTKRTFFRYFSDKREVLFAGEESMPEQVAQLLVDAPPSVAPMEMIASRLAIAATKVFEVRTLEYLLRRRAVIDAEPALQERELRKFSLMSRALEQGLRERGTDDLSAQLTAEIAVTAFRVGTSRWIEHQGDPDLPSTINSTFGAIRDLMTLPAN